MRVGGSIIFSLLTIAIIYIEGINAQSVARPLSDFDQTVRVGLVDEFFDRFNGKTSNKALIDADRKKELLILFDLEQFSSYEHPRFIAASGMVDRIIADSVKINYPDSSWMAVAGCKGELYGSPVEFQLQLKVKSRGEGMYKWVISAVSGKIFNVVSKNVNPLTMLYPDDHETNFMSLARMTAEQPENVEAFLADPEDYDPTSVFEYLVYNKKLKITGVKNLEFVFFQVPGYVFHVRYFNRAGNNAGWLISDFYETSPAGLDDAKAGEIEINDKEK